MNDTQFSEMINKLAALAADRDAWREKAQEAEADAAMCGHYTKRALTAEAALAAVPNYASYYAEALDNWYSNGTRILSFSEWLKYNTARHMETPRD